MASRVSAHTIVGVHAFYVLESKGKRRVGYLRQTSAGRWMALSFADRQGERIDLDRIDWGEARLGHYLDREVAMEAIRLAWHVRANPRPEDRCGVELQLPSGELEPDAF